MSGHEQLCRVFRVHVNYGLDHMTHDGMRLQWQDAIKVSLEARSSTPELTGSERRTSEVLASIVSSHSYGKKTDCGDWCVGVHCRR